MRTLAIVGLAILSLVLLRFGLGVLTLVTLWGAGRLTTPNGLRDPVEEISTFLFFIVVVGCMLGAVVWVWELAMSWFTA